MIHYFQEGDGHCEQHPNIDHLDVGGDRHALRKSKEATKNINMCNLLQAFLYYLHSRQGQHDRHINLNDHVDVLLSKETSGEADDDQQHGRDEHGEQIVDNWSSEGDFNYDGFFVVDG